MSDTKVQVSPEFATKRDTLARKYRGITSRHDKALSAITPEVSSLTFEAFESGAVGTGRKRPEGQESQGDYAARFGVSSANVTRWRRLGRALSLGITVKENDGATWKALQRVVNDSRIPADEGTAQQIREALSKVVTPDGKVVPAKREATPDEGDKGAAEVTLSAANVVAQAEALSAQIVKNWEAWNLSAETASALLDALAGAAEFVGEQSPKRGRKGAKAA